MMAPLLRFRDHHLRSTLQRGHYQQFMTHCLLQANWALLRFVWIKKLALLWKLISQEFP